MTLGHSRIPRGKARGTPCAAGFQAARAGQPSPFGADGRRELSFLGAKISSLFMPSIFAGSWRLRRRKILRVLCVSFFKSGSGRCCFLCSIHCAATLPPCIGACRKARKRRGVRRFLDMHPYGPGGGSLFPS